MTMQPKSSLIDKLRSIIVLGIQRILGKNLKTEQNVLSKQNPESDPPNMNDIMDSIFKAQRLYDELKVKYHPDKFASDPIKMSKAETLFKEITESKRDYKKLIGLAQRAEKTIK